MFAEPETFGDPHLEIANLAIRNRVLLPVRRNYKTRISLEFISISKHSNFENRTESAESRASEKNGPFGE
jgi:hypothetical protein